MPFKRAYAAPFSMAHFAGISPCSIYQIQKEIKALTGGTACRAFLHLTGWDAFAQ
jgi:hypothetical protein